MVAVWGPPHAHNHLYGLTTSLVRYAKRPTRFRVGLFFCACQVGRDCRSDVVARWVRYGNATYETSLG